MTPDDNLLARLEDGRQQGGVLVRPMDPADSREWQYDGERIHHRTGRFFSIVGIEHLESVDGEVTTRRQPIIDQQEIGTLAFLFRTGTEGPEVLIQMKGEPGNVGGLQLAPTCQATLSNLERAHGGQPPPGSELAGPTSGLWQVLSDSLQTEQGTRFLGKRNRNLSLLWTGPGLSPTWGDERFVWTDVRSLVRLLDHDFAVNTDARSVLVTTPWDQLSSDPPFTGRDDPFTRRLHHSYERQHRDDAVESGERVIAWLADIRERRGGDRPVVIPLDDLPQHRLDKRGLSGTRAGLPFDVCHFQVLIPGRERERWDQPLVDSSSVGLARLCAYQTEDGLRFVFAAAAEPGLFDGVELHPTVVMEPGRTESASGDIFAQEDAGEVVAEVQQSEEGGRFYRDINVYQVVLMHDRNDQPPEDYVGLSLREIEWLAPRGVFTNEARSTLSLLLAYL